MKLLTFYEQIRHDPAKAAALFLTLIAFFLLIHQIYSGLRQDLRLSTGLAKQERVQQKGLVDPRQVLDFSLFGSYIPPNLSEKLVKPSTLDFTIVGILYAKLEAYSAVIIRRAGKEGTYHLGDTLPGDVVIKRINPRGIVVLHKGSLEGLSLPQNELTFKPLPKPLTED